MQTIKKSIGLIGVLTALAILFCPSALASEDQRIDGLDLEKLADIIKREALQGDREAQYLLSGLYLTGQGVLKKSYEESFKWLKLAGEQGHVLAQHELGMFYRVGWGVKKNYKEGFKWTKLSAEQGHEKAQIILDKLGVQL